MPPHLTVVIINGDRTSADAIETLLRTFGDVIKIAGTAPDLADGLRVVQTANPNLVILKVDDIETGTEEVKLLLQRFPRLSVFVTSTEKSSDWILKLMRAGASEYILEPVEMSDLAESIQKITRIWAPIPAEVTGTGKIFSVYNPIGGMGTTTVAVNLAAILAQNNEKVALVDLNLFSGDVASFLNVNPTYTLSSVTSNVSRLDSSFLMSVMTKHSSGMYVLTEPVEVDETANITTEQIHRVLAMLRTVFTYIVIDTGGSLMGCNSATFESSDCILFNTVLSLPSLKNAKRYLTAMEKRGLRRDKIKLIVNRYLPRADIRVQDAEKVLDYKVYVTIPNDYNEVIASINKGQPVVNISPRSPVSRSLVQLAELLKSRFPDDTARAAATVKRP
jgi:pilus assembly protein CpaE